MEPLKTTRVKVTSSIILSVFVVGSFLVALIAAPLLERYFQIQAGLRGKDTLQLTVAGLTGALHRYEPLPSLIAEKAILVELLNAPDNEALVEAVNEDLRLAAFRLKASDIYIMDVTGTTIATSNYKKELSFLGRNFAYRPYFTQALEGGTGRFFALGSTSGERGYFFGAPIEDGARIIGVVALKFTVDSFEEAWRSADHQIIVSDLNGVVFMASQPDWHFKTLRPLSRTDMLEIETNRQYPKDQLMPLVNTMSPLDDGLDTVQITDAGTTTNYVSSSIYLANAAWNVRILVPTTRARTQMLAALLILVLAIMLIGLAFAFYIQRRARLLERLETQQAAQEQLETRVAERTADLNRTNEQLLEEVSERKAAENRLRRTQAELVQAGKLAALGQMSAALSHEFNQPLAAVKSYADNAVKLLDIGRTDETRENVTRISEMADRMASISKHLRNFARRPGEKTRPVVLTQIINDSRALVQPRLKSANASLEFAIPDKDIQVLGGHIRLQQVIVNLFTNALDAMKDQAHPVIDMTLEDQETHCTLTVRDHGPGVLEGEFEKIFDPFYTTKQPGEGMGLGLSISYNIIKDFGGDLRVTNHPDGGAVFELTLRKVTEDQPAQTTKELETAAK
ncbi:two component sensor kinase [Roseibium sp. TrichSKD4]|uniref:ATP-binding protein n=1 Tax=Roseibium sp. TrichSKD4 TaxID=744980 RepID=UPI0001E56D0D|nr:ATP-binding protein [Roseibium sp. TrichSKD4]EFO30227.1 two component sensor kinase [Roseibium sp. TrichSKD4]